MCAVGSAFSGVCHTCGHDHNHDDVTLAAVLLAGVNPRIDVVRGRLQRKLAQRDKRIAGLIAALMRQREATTAAVEDGLYYRDKLVEAEAQANTLRGALARLEAEFQSGNTAVAV